MDRLRTWGKSTFAYILFCRDSDDDNLIMLAVGRVLDISAKKAHEYMTNEERTGHASCGVWCANFLRFIPNASDDDDLFFVVVLSFCFVPFRL